MGSFAHGADRLRADHPRKAPTVLTQLVQPNKDKVPLSSESSWEMPVTKGSDKRKSDYPIDALFLDRWSPRAMSGEPISETVLKTLLEAARWAPSSFNAQPWRML